MTLSAKVLAGMWLVAINGKASAMSLILCRVLLLALAGTEYINQVKAGNMKQV